MNLNIVGDFGLAQLHRLLVSLTYVCRYLEQIIMTMTFFDIFRTGGSNNYGKYSSEKYDQVLDQLSKEQDNDKRIKLYGEAESILIKDDAAIKLFFIATNTAI